MNDLFSNNDGAQSVASLPPRTCSASIVADFTALPFPDGSFAVVIFDPPHFARNGSKGWMAKKYGTLEGDWKEMLRLGFAECFRVLRPEGTLIFKWNEHEVPVSQILALTPQLPLLGQRCGKTAKTHWIVFMKPNARADLPPTDARQPRSGTEGVIGG